MLLSQSYKKANRNKVLDIAKGIGILLVVYFHAIQIGMMPANLHDADATRIDFSLWRFVYSFHMPFFFLASGITYKRHETEYVLKDSLRLFFIAQASGAIGLVIKYFLLSPEVFTFTLEKDFFQPFILNYNFSIIVTWFLVALAIIRIAYHFFETGGIKHRISILYLLLGGFVISKLFSAYPYEAGAILPGFLFFMIGHKLSVCFLSDRNLSKFSASAGFILTLILTYFVDSLNHGCLFSFRDHCDNFKGGFAVLMIYGSTGFIPLFLIAAISGSISLILLANTIKITSNRLSNGLSFLGTFSLEILIINGFFLKIFEPYLKKLMNFETLSPELSLAAGGILAIIQIFVFLGLFQLRKKFIYSQGSE